MAELSPGLSPDDPQSPSPTDAATPPTSEPTPVEPRQAALLTVVRELEQHVAAQGWDGPMRLFALVRTAGALARDPELAAQLPPDVVAAANADPEHLTAVEQEELPEAEAVEELLAQIQWPPSVDGVALAVERLVLPPEASAALPDDPDAARTMATAHPKGRDMRLVSAALRSGQTASAIRLREYDQDAMVTIGADLLPELNAALLENLSS